MALADVVEEAQEPSATIYETKNLKYCENHLKNLQERCKAKLKLQGFQNENIVMENYLHMRLVYMELKFILNLKIIFLFIGTMAQTVH